VRPRRERGAVARRPAARPVRAWCSPARLRVHAAVGGGQGGRAGRDRLRAPDQHDRVGGRGVGRPAGAGRGPAPSRAVLRGRAAVRQRRPGHGAHRPGGPGAGGPRADRLVSARRGQDGRRRRAVLRQRPPAGAGARAAGGPGGRRHRGGGRVHRRLPARLAGQEAAGRGAGRRLPAGRARARPHRRAPRFVSAQPPFLAELFSLDGRIAVVTGGSSGIGAGIAGALARAGARVVLVARDAGRLEEAAAGLRACGAGAAWVSADLAERAEVARAAAAAAGAFGPPDILVNCAGINLRPPLGSLTVEDWDATMAVNLTAPFLLGQRFGPDMAERGWGRIINVTSQQAARAFGNSGGYGASKGGLAALTRSQSEAWASSGVCCNSVCPGFVPTRLNAHVARDPERSAAMAARTMTGRNGSPEDFAGVAVFLASRASDYVTGQTLYVDGGFSVT